MKVVGLAGNIGSGKDSVARILERDHGFQPVAFADELKRLAQRLFDLPDAVLWGPSGLRNGVVARAGADAFWDDVQLRCGRQHRYIVSLFEDAPKTIDQLDVINSLNVEFNVLRARGADLTARFVLQRLGTEWGRALWSGVWINSIGVAIQAMRRGHGYDRAKGIVGVAPNRSIQGVAITDCRFPNEAREVHAWGGQCVWVDASVRCPPKAEHAHASEPSRGDFKEYGVIDMAGFSTLPVDLIDFDVDNNGPESELDRKVGHMLEALYPA